MVDISKTTQNSERNNPSKKWDTLYDAGAKYRDLNEVFVVELNETFKSSTGSNPQHVIDLGCGAGETLARFCKLGIPVTGIDFSADALQKAKTTVLGETTFIQADLEHLNSVPVSVPTNTLWLCKLVLAFIKDKEKFIRSVHDKMNTGDMFLVMTPVLHDNIVYEKEDKPGIAIRFENFDSLILTVFGNKEIFSNEYPGERGHIVSYLVQK